MTNASQLSFDEYLAQVPKVELHAHLIGSMRPDTFAELARASGIALPRPPQEFFPFASFYEFLQLSRLGTTLLNEQSQFARVIYEALEHGLRTSNQRHTEMFFNPQYFMSRGVSCRTVVDGLVAGIREAEALGVSCRLIPSIGRQIDAAAAEELLDAILATRRDEVLGLGIDGAERDGPPQRFTAVYARARKAGLRATAHCCEDNQTLAEGPPGNFTACVNELGCERIDHGNNILADPAVVDAARAGQQCFTTVPVASSPERFVRRLRSIGTMVEQGLNVTVNTDNPAMLNVDLTGAYRCLCLSCGYGVDRVRAFSLAGVESCWLDDIDMRRLRKDFTGQLDALQALLDTSTAPSRAMEDIEIDAMMKMRSCTPV